MQCSAFWTLKLSKCHAEIMQCNAEILKKKIPGQKEGGGAGPPGPTFKPALGEKLATIT